MSFSPKVKISENDTTPGLLEDKLVQGTNITLTVNNDGANETVTIDASGGSMAIGGAVTSGTSGSVLYIDGSGNLAQDNTNFFFDSTLKALRIIDDTNDKIIVGDITGDTRGIDSIDIQCTRSASTQVASGASSLCIGQNNRASNSNSIAIGVTNTLTNGTSIALGVSNSNSQNAAYNILIGSSNVTRGADTIAIGRSNDVGSSGSDNDGSICIGFSNAVTNSNGGDQSTAIGYDNTADSASTVIGTGCSSGQNALAAGYLSSSGANSTGVGRTAVASGTGALATGYIVTASGTPSVAVGSTCTASNTNAVAVGISVTASASASVALGYNFSNATANSLVLSHGGSNYLYIDNTNLVTLGSAGGTSGTKIRIETGGQVSIRPANQGAAYIRPGGTVDVNITAVGNVDTGTDDLQSISLPASFLGENGDSAEIEAFGTFAANANAKTISLLFGSTTLITSGSILQTGGDWNIRAKVIRTGATTQIASATIIINGIDATSLLPASSKYTTPAETLSGAITIKTQGIGVSSDDVSSKGLIVRWFPNN